MDEKYLNSVKSIFGADYQRYIDILQSAPFRSLRVNTLKAGADDLSALPLEESTLICQNGYYTNVKPSLDPLYQAGLYYMQDAGAQGAISSFAHYVGERVLDLCAAPGGKATHLAAIMNGNGLLIANEIDRKRASILSENVERMGVKNCVVTNNDPRDFEGKFNSYFDTVVVDAPCSGEGMMRKENVQWSQSLVDSCAVRQKLLVQSASKLLCKGGYMLYCTCTFNTAENEQIVKFITDLGYETVPLDINRSVDGLNGFTHARRLYPQNNCGEGQFVCALKKITGDTRVDLPLQKFNEASDSTLRVVKPFGINKAVEFKNKVVCPPDNLPDLNTLKVLRLGVELFDDAASLTPSHALALSLTKNQLNSDCAFALTDTTVKEYLSGNEIFVGNPNIDLGYKVATYKGYPLGFVKIARSGTGDIVAKNLLPKRFRVAI